MKKYELSSQYSSIIQDLKDFITDKFGIENPSLSIDMVFMADVVRVSMWFPYAYISDIVPEYYSNQTVDRWFDEFCGMLVKKYGISFAEFDI